MIGSLSESGSEKEMPVIRQITWEHHVFVNDPSLRFRVLAAAHWYRAGTPNIRKNQTLFVVISNDVSVQRYIRRSAALPSGRYVACGVGDCLKCAYDRAVMNTPRLEESSESMLYVAVRGHMITKYESVSWEEIAKAFKRGVEA